MIHLLWTIATGAGMAWFMGGRRKQFTLHAAIGLAGAFAGRLLFAALGLTDLSPPLVWIAPVVGAWGMLYAFHRSRG